MQAGRAGGSEPRRGAATAVASHPRRISWAGFGSPGRAMSRALGFADLGGMPPSGRTGRIRSRRRREDGQTMAEYVVVLAVITPFVILAFAALAGGVLPAINNVRGFL